MRKLTLELVPNKNSMAEAAPLFEKIDAYEVLESLKIDLHEGICIDLVEFELKDGYSIEDQESIGNMEILSVLRSDGNKHTCLIKHQEPEATRDELLELDLDVIYTTPVRIERERRVISVLGEQKDLQRFVEVIRPTAERIVNMTFKPAMYDRKDLLSVLTPKQRETVISAFDYGYYDYPKKIGGDELAMKIGISKGTMLEHLRKAEGRLLREILIGYSSNVFKK